MAKGFDCATPLTPETAATFKASGYEFVARYLVPATSAWKALTKTEADVIQAAGLKIVSVYEMTADRALGGYDAGVADGKTAAQCAKDVGQPTGTTIYFAVDFDVSADQMATVIAYIRGANDATPDYSTGVYGSYDVVNAVKAAGAASHTWQTYAWSSGKLADCQIYQYDNGAEKDEDTSYGLEGWWGTPPVTPPAPVPSKLDPGVALTVINTWIAKSWQDADAAYQKTSDEAWKEQRDYYHWLADQLREAAGIPLSQ